MRRLTGIAGALAAAMVVHNACKDLRPEPPKGLVIEITPPADTLTALGESVQLTATARNPAVGDGDLRTGTNADGVAYRNRRGRSHQLALGHQLHHGKHQRVRGNVSHRHYGDPCRGGVHDPRVHGLDRGVQRNCADLHRDHGRGQVGDGRVQSGVQLTVQYGGGGIRRVVSSPAGIDCGSTCDFRFGEGTAVTLTVTIGAGATVSWLGACSGSTCTVTMDANKTATFTISSGG